MEELHPAFFQLTDDDHAAWVVVITITFFVYTFGAVTAKLSIRYRASGWRPNDTVLALGLVVLFVQTVCVVVSCQIGLGKHQDALTPKRLEQFDQVYLFRSSVFLPAEFRPVWSSI